MARNLDLPEKNPGFHFKSAISFGLRDVAWDRDEIWQEWSQLSEKNLVIETFFETLTDDKLIFAWFFGHDLLGPHTSSPGIVLFDVFIGDYSPPKK